MLELSQQKEDEYLKLVHCLLVFQQFLDRVVNGSTQSLLYLFICDSCIVDYLPF